MMGSHTNFIVEPRQDEEHNQLGEQRCVQIHGNRSLAVDGADYLMNGLPSGTYRAIPVPIMNAASIRPTRRNRLGLQRVHQLGLARRCLEEAAAHDADADTRARSAETDDEAGGRATKPTMCSMTTPLCLGV